VRARAGARRAAGLAWAGARANTNDRRRSMPLAALSPLLERDDIAWFSLQHEDSSDVAGVAAAARLQRLDDRIGFEGLAALVDALDLVVTVDTSVAHVAGALARPVWMMVPFAADWRWGVEETPPAGIPPCAWCASAARATGPGWCSESRAR